MMNEIQTFEPYIDPPGIVTTTATLKIDSEIGYFLGGARASEAQLGKFDL